MRFFFFFLSKSPDIIILTIQRQKIIIFDYITYDSLNI
jgi:hypothetical protein